MATYRNLGLSYRTTDGDPPDVAHYPEAASQTFKAGDLVTLSSGKVAVAVAASTTYASADLEGGTVLGIALADATGVTDTAVPVAIANSRLLIPLLVLHGTPASAVTAVTQVGTAYDIAHYTINGVTTWGYTIDDTSASNIVIHNLDPNYPVGEQYGVAYGIVPAAKRAIAA